MPCMLLWLLPLLLLLCCCCFICLKLCRRRRRARRWREDAFLTEEMKAALNEAKEMLAAAVSAREEAQREVEELRRQHKDQGEEMIAAIETWEAALVITRAHAHRLRGPRARVMDLAGGHGLLALAILVLNPECPSAVVVDKRKPDSHERLCDVFVRQWPRLRGRVRFVEASVEQATPSPDTLLVSVHACGGLTDLILELAVGGGAPVAVVPCCHRALARPRELAARLRDADERGTAYEAPFAAGNKSTASHRSG